MTDLKEKLEDMIDLSAGQDIARVTGSVVKEAISKLKPGKADVSGSYVSGGLKNSPDLLYEHLANIFRSWLCHGSVTSTLLACSFLPLLKSFLNDPEDPAS